MSNNILQRAFTEHVAVSPMKLQKLLFFTASEYIKMAGLPLLGEAFLPWRYGPVVCSVYNEFRSFGGQPIWSYAKDATGTAYVLDRAANPHLRSSLTRVWRAGRDITAVQLSRFTHADGSAWSRTYGRSRTIDDDAMRDDRTYATLLGLT